MLHYLVEQCRSTVASFKYLQSTGRLKMMLIDWYRPFVIYLLIGFFCGHLAGQEEPPCPVDNWEYKPFQPIRIKWFEISLPGFTEDSRDTIRKLMNDTVDFFYSTFLVRRINFPINLLEDDATACDGDIIKHTDLQGHITNMTSCDMVTGVHDVDFVIYLRQATPPNCQPGGGTIASARPCGTRVSFDKRQLLGRVSVCPYVVNTEKWNQNALLKTLQHEIMHALGFMDKGWKNLNYKDGGQEIIGLQENVVRTWKINNSTLKTNTSKFLVSPRVKSFVREHFKCPTLEGAELENEGSSGTEGLHFDKRIYGGETMSGYSSRRSYLTAMTFAVFEDTKWYRTNYTPVDELTTGKGAGCIFARNSCREYMDSVGDSPGAAKPYCNWGDYVEWKKAKSMIRECSSDREYYMECDFAEQENLEKDRAYFLDKWTIVDKKNVTGEQVSGWQGGRDGCPSWVEIKGGEGKIGDSVCTNKHAQPAPEGNWGAEIFGEESLCLKQEGKFEIYECKALGRTNYYTEKGAHGAGCYKYKCANGRLMIQANYSDPNDPKHKDEYLYMEHFKVCWGNNTVINIKRHQFSGPAYERRFHKGFIVCPPCASVCHNNTRYPDFQCSREIRLNTTDLNTVPCDQG